MKTDFNKKQKPQSMLLICLVSACLSVTGMANAAEKTEQEVLVNPYKKSFKVDLPKNTHAFYAGVGLSNGFMHFLAEKPTRIGNFYAKIGQFYGGTGVAGQVGYRYPYKLTGVNNNGVYVGAFAGHVADDRKDGKRYNRLGAGIDISYLWFDASRIGALSMGLYFAEPTKEANGERKEIKPKLMASISLAAGLF